jgi:hypothetical protein
LLPFYFFIDRFRAKARETAKIEKDVDAAGTGILLDGWPPIRESRADDKDGQPMRESSLIERRVNPELWGCAGAGTAEVHVSGHMLGWRLAEAGEPCPDG